MYSSYIASALQSSELPEAAQDALRNLFGNCSIDLNHKAPVTIEVPNAENSSINYQTFLNNITNEINNHTDEYYYAFSPQLFSYIDDNDTIQGGFNIYAPGVNFTEVQMSDNIITNNIETNNITIEGYTFQDQEVVTDVSWDEDTCIMTKTTKVIKVPVQD